MPESRDAPATVTFCKSATTPSSGRALQHGHVVEEEDDVLRAGGPGLCLQALIILHLHVYHVTELHPVAGLDIYHVRFKPRRAGGRCGLGHRLRLVTVAASAAGISELHLP